MNSAGMPTAPVGKKSGGNSNASSGVHQREAQGAGKTMFKASTITEFLFCNEDGFLPSTPDNKHIDEIYNDYIKVLSSMYDRLRGRYNNFAQKCLQEEDKRNL